MQQIVPVFLPVFLAVFLAELGDKTQLATLLFATDQQRDPVVVFFAAGTALLASTAVAVVVGMAAQQHLSAAPLKLIAGIGFVAMGLWTIYTHFSVG